MTEERLTALLAQRVMGWTVGPDRFLTGKRGWMPRWRFRPLEELADAFELLDRAADAYELTRDRTGVFTAAVQVGPRRVQVAGEFKARAITLAVARALVIDTGRVADPRESAKKRGGKP